MSQKQAKRKRQISRAVVVDMVDEFREALNRYAAAAEHIRQQGDAVTAADYQAEANERDRVVEMYTQALFGIE